MKTSRPSFLSIVAVLVAMVLVGATLLPHLRPSTELVRLRNALLFQPSTAADFDWTPAQVPADFAVDASLPAEPFGSLMATLDLGAARSDWDKSIAIAAHLIKHARHGNPAKDDLEGTYRQIMAGGGYCADYTSVFIAIARRAGVFAREWAFSFDGYGGWGHALIEVFDRESGQWRMLDVFNNFHPVDSASGRPLSVAEFRHHVASGEGAVALRPIGPGRPGFRDTAALYEYYRRGVDQWYLWWGNAVYAYDASPSVRWLGHLSRSGEQLGAIVLGLHPTIRAVPSDSNGGMRQAMLRLKWRLLATAASEVLLGLLLLTLLIRWLRGRAADRQGPRHA